MVGLCGIGGDNDEDAANHKEIVHDCPPCVGWKAVPRLNLSNDGRNEGNHPCQLQILVSHNLAEARERGNERLEKEEGGW